MKTNEKEILYNHFNTYFINSLENSYISSKERQKLVKDFIGLDYDIFVNDPVKYTQKINFFEENCYSPYKMTNSIDLWDALTHSVLLNYYFFFETTDVEKKVQFKNNIKKQIKFIIHWMESTSIKISLLNNISDQNDFLNKASNKLSKLVIIKQNFNSFFLNLIIEQIDLENLNEINFETMDEFIDYSSFNKKFISFFETNFTMDYMSYFIFSSNFTTWCLVTYELKTLEIYKDNTLKFNENAFELEKIQKRYVVLEKIYDFYKNKINFYIEDM